MLGVGEGGVVGEVVVVGFRDVVEGGGKRGMGSEVEEGDGVEGGEGGRACREFWGGRAGRSNGEEGGNVGEVGVAD